ncbi:MAG: LCP family protein [Parcubacteria group bacterium]
MTRYPSLHALRKKDAQSAVAAVAQATTKPKAASLASNPLIVKKLKKTRRSRTTLKVIVVAAALMFVSGTVFGARMLTVGNGFFGNQSDGFFAQLRALFGDSRPLIGEGQDRVNILLLGIGGEGHDGPNLSDTIIVASLKPSTHEAAMLSLPRDLYAEIPGYGHNKLNAAFALGEESGYPGGGAQLATETIEEITGLDLPYYTVVDFKGFEKIIDDLGGLDIDIPRAFYDNLHAIQYDAGPHHFSGKEALYFVRARYVDGSEGGDFARAARTQLVAKQLQQKALALNPVADLGTITSILQNLGDHVRTNLQPAELRRLYELIHELSLDNVRNKVVDEAETGLVAGGGADIGGLNVSVLLPTDATGQAIKDYAANVFEKEPPKPEDATLEVQNGTATPGTAATFDTTVTLEIPILSVTNADQSDYEETFIVDNTDGSVPIALQSLQDKLGVFGIEAQVIPIAHYPNQSAADLILVLGQDYADALNE